MDNVMFKERKTREKVSSKTGMSSSFSSLLNIGYLILSAFLVFNSVRSMQIAQEKLRILDRAQVEVTDLRLRNISLILDKGKIETDDFTETDIRNRLNYSKKNEIVFVLSEDVLGLAKSEVDRILEKKTVEVSRKEVWEVWKDLFVYGI